MVQSVAYSTYLNPAERALIMPIVDIAVNCYHYFLVTAPKGGGAYLDLIITNIGIFEIFANLRNKIELGALYRIQIANTPTLRHLKRKTTITAITSNSNHKKPDSNIYITHTQHTHIHTQARTPHQSSEIT